jgi:hypothetical protein
MRFLFSLVCITLAGASLMSPSSALAATPEEAVAGIANTFFGKAFVADWSGIEKLPGIQWAPLPPTSLQNCLPDGGCFTRAGKAVIGGRNFVVIATGARTIVSNVYLRNANPTSSVGASAVLAALKALNITASLARCPVPGTPGGTNWYRLKGAVANPGILSVQSSCGGRPCEGFTFTQGDELPALQPAQLKMYSEQCGGAPAERKAVAAASMPHEALAEVIAGLIPPVSGPAVSDWKALEALPAPIKWLTPPQKMSLLHKMDPNPFARTGEMKVPGRNFSVLGSGTSSQALVVHLDESGMHPRGEHLLGVLYTKGLQVQLVRCGPIYTESTNNWYSLKSAKTHPVMIQQSIRYDGNQVQDTYQLRFDNTLPKRDPRDRDPGVGGCR